MLNKKNNAINSENINESLVDDAYIQIRSLPKTIVFDHARAGNNFFKRLFDEHSEVLSLSPIGYLLTRVIILFDGRKVVPANEIIEWALADSNVNRVIGELREDTKFDLTRIGDDIDAEIDRKKSEAVMRYLLDSVEEVSINDLISIISVSYMLGMGKAANSIKYIMFDEVVNNDLPNGKKINADKFKVISSCLKNTKIIHLVRDPRGNFASIRHQYVNIFGNMYPVRSSKIWKSVFCNNIWLWVLKYTSEGADDLYKYGNSLGENQYRIIRIEDVNEKFHKTMLETTEWLGVSYFKPWDNNDYYVTSSGAPWKAISAFSTRYTGVKTGILDNENEDNFEKVKPNPELTSKKRWLSKLLPRESKFLEAFYYKELKENNYPIDSIDSGFKKIFYLFYVLLPFSGEIPRSAKWWFNKDRIDKKIVFIITLPFTYLISRVLFFFFILSGRVVT